MDMTEEEITAELEKCLADPRYFYNTYWQVDGKPVTPISEEEWNARMHFFYMGGRGGPRFKTAQLIRRKHKN